jgi:hypothetical protein
MRSAIVLAAAAAALTVTAASMLVGQGQGQTRSAQRELLVRSPDGRTIVTVNAGGNCAGRQRATGDQSWPTAPPG